MIAIIGCGNVNRADDGAGLAVLDTLRERGFEEQGVRLLDAGTDGMGVIYAAQGCRTLIIIDASRTGSTPGAVFELPGWAVENAPPPSFSLHDFRWDHALFAGRRTYGQMFPHDVVVLLIEAGSLAFGMGLSPVVANAAAKVADRVAELIASRTQERHAS